MIKFTDIQISYGDFVAVDNLNLEIQEGEFFTFLGPSGCGKSTTLRALVGFNIPTRGKIEVGGRDVTRLEPEAREIGIVFQSYALFPTMTVYENIAFGLKVKKMKPEIIREKVNEVAKKIKIRKFPELIFQYDTTAEYALHIESLIASVSKKEKDEE